MDIRAAYDELTRRHLAWRLRDVRREVDHDFPMVKTIQDTTTVIFLRYVQDMSREERYRLLRASILVGQNKWLKGWDWCLQGTTLTPEAVTPEEEAMVAAYDKYRSHMIYTLPYDLFLRGPDDERVPLKRGKLVKLARQRLSDELGLKFKRDDNLTWEAELSVGEWDIRTTVDTDVTYGVFLQYHHHVLRRDHGGDPANLGLPLYPFHGNSLLSWLRIGATMWDTPYEIYAEPAVESLCRAVAHYLKEIPPLLTGMGVDD